MIYFTSDWHLNESRIFDFNPFFRPFNSIEEQNLRIIDEINKSVSSIDTLYHLGDVSIDLEGLQLLDNIKCQNRYLILGNYDYSLENKLGNYFEILGHEYELNIKDTLFYLNHYPSKIAKHQFGLVGHIHGLWKVQPNMINVGVDAWHFKPVSLEEILFTKKAIECHYDDNVFIKY